MRCNKVKKLLSDCLDNSLNIIAKDEVKEHLDKCMYCADYFKNMTKLDNLIKLKAKERPSKEYFENYWQRLKSKLDKSMVPQISENRNSFNRFIPKFTPAFSRILIILLIFINGFLYINIRQINALQSNITEKQEKVQQETCKYLTYLRNQIYN